MNASGICGRADLVRALAVDRDDLVDILAKRLGYVSSAPASEIQRVPDTGRATLKPQKAPDSDTGPIETVFWRPVHYQAVPREGKAFIPVTLPTPPPSFRLGGPDPDPAPHHPLAPWRDIEPRLRRPAAQHRESRELDTGRILRSLTHGRMLQRLPHRRRLCWGTSIRVVIDRSEHLVPFWADQEFVLSRLLRLFGPNGVERALFHECLDEPSMLGRRNAPGAWPPPSGSTVLVLGDLGCLHSGSEKPWLCLGRQLATANCRAVALFPAPLDRCSRALRAWWHVLPWERARSAGSIALAERRRRADRLLRLLAPGIRIEPGLLRAARMLIPAGETDAGTLADAWRHPAISGGTIVAAGFHPDAAEDLRADFEQAASDDATAKEQRETRDALDLLRSWRQELPAEIWYEEVLKLGPNAEKRIPEQERENARAFFAAFAGHLLSAPTSGPSTHARQAWFRRVCERNPERLFEDSEIGADLQRLGCQIFRNDPATTRPSWYDPALLPAKDNDDDAAWRVDLRQIECILSFEPKTAAQANEPYPSGMLATMETINGQIIVLETETEDRAAFWTSGLPPSWAEDWGWDAYGAWVRFSIAGVRQRLRWIPPGRFVMGSPADEPGRFEWEGPQHEVTLARGFWLFDTPVTQALWEAVMGKNPSEFKSPDRPVEQVSWEDAQAFLERINGRVPGLDLCLPSEAQWEYACRAGTTSALYTGDMEILGERNAPALDPIAWYGGNSGRGFELDDGDDTTDWEDKQYPDTKAGTHPVGRKGANPWGLHDMLGNVWEWCEDHGHDSYEGAPTDGGPWLNEDKAGGSRVVRGGSWIFDARYVRSAYRYWNPPGIRGDSLGFRCARVPVSPAGGGAEPAEPASARPAERPGAATPGRGAPLLRLREEPRQNFCALPRVPAFVVRSDCERLAFRRFSRPGWAEAVGRDRFGLWSDVAVGEVRQRMRWIPPGRFMMGSPEDEPGRFEQEGPRHEVTLAKGFWLFDTPVTQALWAAVMGKNPSEFKSPDRPVEQVSWENAQAFLERINGLVPGLDLCLPSEAQWEYACRAGTTTPYNFGDTVTRDQANFGAKETVPVKSLPANSWGLYEMHGNVWEWCEDHRHDSYKGAPTDGSPWLDESGKAGGNRVGRGGSWILGARNVRSACRFWNPPGSRSGNLGFRCARVQS